MMLQLFFSVTPGSRLYSTVKEDSADDEGEGTPIQITGARQPATEPRVRLLHVF
jgi:hypothetical protein